jgi:anti-sigma-K factor RskA
MEPSHFRVSAGALALGIAIGLALPLAVPLWRSGPPDGELPESYVGVLAAPEGSTGIVVSAVRHGRVLDTRLPVPVAMPDGSMLFLWAIEPSGAVSPVGPVPPQASGRSPRSDRAASVFATVVGFGVTVERSGEVPQSPAGAFVYRGVCGRLWRAGAPAA